jgi:hypothetical protein
MATHQKILAKDPADRLATELRSVWALPRLAARDADELLEKILGQKTAATEALIQWAHSGAGQNNSGGDAGGHNANESFVKQNSA